MSWFYQLFFPAHDPTEEELHAGRRRIIEEGAVAGIIYALVTGNFLAGSWRFRVVLCQGRYDTILGLRTAVFLTLRI